MEEPLSAWFQANGRDLPWRDTKDPYAILVSEVMAQQTQVSRVLPRWERWLELWPTVRALAEASPADVIREWQGLGYNRRGLNLHRAAQHVAAHGWPEDLTDLPGVGRYTADAVACFAFGRDVLPVDVNVRRVVDRTGHEFSSASAQALMDLGATVCLARVPRCYPASGSAFVARTQGAPIVQLSGRPRTRPRAARRRREAAELAAGCTSTMAAMVGSLATLLIPVWILLGLLFLLGSVALLGRIQGGRYLRPLVALIAKVPLFRRWMQKASNAALERSNPELASAMKKMQRTGAMRDPMKAQAAMSQLTRDERRALLDLQDQQGSGVPPEATNRQMRRRLEKAQKNAKRR